MIASPLTPSSMRWRVEILVLFMMVKSTCTKPEVYSNISSTPVPSPKVAYEPRFLGFVKSVAEKVFSTVKGIVTSTSPMKDVCYGYLGCFSMASPWHSPLRILPPPQSPEAIATQFYLYSRGTVDRWNVTTLPEVSLEGSIYDGEKRTFFVTHGFTSDGNTPWMKDLKNALLKKYDANVILVDWGKGAKELNYFQVASNTRIVAAEIIRLVKHMIEKQAFDPSKLHLIGHSLGAQISSYVAKEIPNVGMLTALDPAQPGFEWFDKRVRLDANDASFVQVIHTSGRPFIPFIGMGMIHSHGHVDFYLNGGWRQPGCIIPTVPQITSISNLATVPVEVIANLVACSHGRSVLYFIESLENENCTFWGHRSQRINKFFSTITGGHVGKTFALSSKCDKLSCLPLGVDAINYPARGDFDVGTNFQKPFCVPEPRADAKMKKYRNLNTKYHKMWP